MVPQSFLDAFEFKPDRAGGTPVHQPSYQKLKFREIDGQDTFIGAPAGFDGIHFPILHFISMAVFEIAVCSSDKGLPVFDLGIMTFTLFEFHFAFQVNIPAQQYSHVDIVIQR